jgi:zinc D-Ala-D-Ala carboxypeptidase
VGSTAAGQQCHGQGACAGVPKSKWRRANFSPAEIACCGDGSIKVCEDALDCLQALRDLMGKPMIVLSGYRSPQHNRRVGGAPASKHMQGTSFDISMANHDPVAFEAAGVGLLGGGDHKEKALPGRQVPSVRTSGVRWLTRLADWNGYRVWQ